MQLWIREVQLYHADPDTEASPRQPTPKTAYAARDEWQVGTLVRRPILTQLLVALTAQRFAKAITYWYSTA